MTISQTSNEKEAAQQRMLTLIREEITLHEQHLHLLLEQKRALVACNRGRFATVHDQCEDLLARQQAHASARAQALPGSASALKREIAKWPTAYRDEAQALLDRLRDLAARIRLQSQQNQTLIANDLRLVNFELDLIMTALSKGSHYARSGTPEQSEANRLINRTA